MRYTRLLFGAVFIALTLWILVGEQIAGVSANAVINAPVITIRSSIAGSLSIPDRPFGARVNQTEVVASIDNVLVDRVRLNDLRMERDFQEAAIRRITERLETETTIQQHLNERTRLYRQYRLEELRIQLSHARTRLSIAERA
ncbi:MAG: HlyD family secretion protein, partial [Roseovarius sp.]|nr:HlyD family secretion protein [Roseovarius sp.]MBQ0812081.1 HlyD family secretion protein [Roseovarius sp.]